MTKKNIFYIIIIIVATTLTIRLNISNARRQIDYTLFDPIIDVSDLIREHYVSETDYEALISGAINGMLRQLDIHSEYIPPSKLDAFQKQTSGSYEGIGISIDPTDDYITVISPFEGSPAFKAGIQPGDIILEVDGHNTQGWSSTQAVQKLTGPAKSSVTLKVLHPDQTEAQITITRKKITLPIVKGFRRNTLDGAWDFMLDDIEKIGYIRLTQFTAQAPDDFDHAVKKLLDQNLKALLLDLRSNPGGLMSAAIEIADHFLVRGTIVSTRGANSRPQVSHASSRGTYPNFKLVILINQFSASASEIVAGALQDHDRALIVGKRSWGKGSVQRVFILADSNAALKITTDYYYLPNGRCVHKLPNAEVWGVDPDVEQDFDLKKSQPLRKLIIELTIDPLTIAGKRLNGKDQPENEEPPQTLTQQDHQLKQSLAIRLLELDDQLAEAYKQAKQLLNTNPELIPLSQSLNQ